MRKLRSGDRVVVTAGKDRGREGKILRMLPDEDRAIVEGVNRYKRHRKPRGKDQPGKIEERERPLPVANVMLLCPKCGQPARVGFTVKRNAENKGKKTRVCKRCGKELDS